jgi:hypothetical protein
MNAKTTTISLEQVNSQLLFCDKISALWIAEGRTPRAYVETYGCQQNEADSERIRGMLAQSGYTIAEEAEKAADWENDPLCGMTQEEYNEMYERIRAELMEELMHCVQISEKK